MIQLLDIGNTAVKICQVGHSGDIDNVRSIPLSESLAVLATGEQPADVAIIAATAHEDILSKAASDFSRRNVRTLILDKNGAIPFVSRYARGEAGIDRLANVAAAIQRYGSPCIILDAGTAITTEIVAPDGVFLGGSIFPGLQLQAESLHRGTAMLPTVGVSKIIDGFGTNTHDAIRSGILHGVIGSAEHLIDLARQMPDMNEASVVLTGGDSVLIASQLQMHNPVVDPHLTLRGLYLLARHRYPEAFLD